MSSDIHKALEFSDKAWGPEVRAPFSEDKHQEEDIIHSLSKFITIQNQSPLFDPNWEGNGYTKAAVELLVGWVEKQKVPGLTIEVSQSEKRTPVIFIEIPATKKENVHTVLLYGHLDKQPPLTDQWTDGLHPYVPIIRDGKLYGRGGADDGYSTFASVAAVQALKAQNIPHDRYVILIEAAEESGSIDLPFHMEKLKGRIGEPSLVVCLDSGCGNYEQFWLTSSLRGIVVGTLEVKLLREGVHSGSASGVVPSTFRILRDLLDRVEDKKTGEMIQDFHVKIPEYRIEQAKYTATLLGDSVWSEFPFLPGATPVAKDLTQLLLQRSWHPTLCVTGVEGIPTLSQAGNVLRPYASVKLSVRVPPSGSAEYIQNKLKEILEKDPPYGAHVKFIPDKSASGWESPAPPQWLEEALGRASLETFKKPHAYMGEGGSIPFLGMLGIMYPKTQFVVTGLLGPQSNAHGPNEFLHIGMGKKVTACVSYILAEQARH
eukprot:TRINITY_DN1128_c0_g1_i1.p1 TRINITY_DN1128_c0_g1~~TRINITY_DN1128_c0_g1_i1.p1  ORF type:complete len:488 (+),score=110.34 TRINITY_DN1128_c0_g1_i1:195-1658(+)